MTQRIEYVSEESAIKHDDLIEIKGEALAGIATYKPGRVEGTLEYAFSEQYIMVYFIEAEVIEILTIVPTALNWVNSTKKIESLI